MSDVRQLVVASENTDAVQAIYVDGKLTHFDDTIYAIDIAEASEGKPVVITQEQVDLPEGADWPDTLQQLRELQEQLFQSEDPKSMGWVGSDGLP